MSQWASLHSLKDARHGPEVTHRVELHCSHWKVDKARNRPGILRGAGNGNPWGWWTKSCTSWDDRNLRWYMIRDIYCILWWLILPINIHHMELESWYYDAMLVPLVNIISLQSSLTRIVIMNVCSGALASSSTAVWHRSQWQGPSGRWIEIGIVWWDTFDCFTVSFGRFWTPLTSWNHFIWPSPTWKWHETPWKPKTPSYQLVSLVSFVSSGYQLTGKIVRV